jgi:hypothetical protein
VPILDVTIAPPYPLRPQFAVPRLGPDRKAPADPAYGRRTRAYRKVGWETSDDNDAYSNACRLERRPEILDRITYLTSQAEELIAEKRQRIEEQLWDVLDADIGDLFETVEVAKSDKDGKAETDEAGKMLTVKKQRPRLLSDLPPDLRKAIEHVVTFLRPMSLCL